MADLDQQFERLAEEIKELKTRPNDAELLEIYGLFKQATTGDCTQSKPGMFQLKEKAKHEAWVQKKGMSQTEAKEAYVAKAKVLVATYGSK